MMNGKLRLIIRVDELPWILYFLVATGFDSIKMISPIIGKAWNYAVVLFFIGLLLLLSINRVISLNYIFLTSFLYIPVIVTIISRGWHTQSVIHLMKCLMMVFGFNKLVESRGIKDTISILLRVFEILLYVNFIAMLLYPNGLMLYRNINNHEVWRMLSRNYKHISSSERVAWLLDHQGLITMYVSTGSCLAILWAHLESRTLLNPRTVLMFVISILEVYFFSKSANGIVTFSLFLGGVIIANLWSRFGKKLPSIWRIIVVGGVLFIGVVYYNIQQNFSWLIVDILGRDLTLTGRIAVWQQAIEVILRKPIFGWGYVDSLEGFVLFGGAAHTHNQFLNIAYQGGMVSLMGFLFFLFKSVITITEQGSESQIHLVPIWSSVIAMIVGMFGDRYIPYYSIAFVSFLLALRSDLIVSGCTRSYYRIE